jgi:hypothetical protein
MADVDLENFVFRKVVYCRYDVTFRMVQTKCSVVDPMCQTTAEVDKPLTCRFVEALQLPVHTHTHTQLLKRFSASDWLIFTLRATVVLFPNVSCVRRV